MTTAATITPGPDMLRDEQAALRSRLARLRGRLRLQMALEFALDAAAGVAAAGACLVALDYGLRPGLTTRLVLLGLALAGIAAALVARAIPRVKAARLDDLSLAMTLDRVRPGTGGQVADVLQLPGQLGGEGSTASPALVRLAVRRAGEALAAVDWRLHWNGRRTAARAAGFLAALLVPVAFAALAPAAARLSLGRWLLGSSERWPQRTYLSVVGLGDRDRLVAPRDEPFALEVRADLPKIEPRGGSWVVPGRGEPLALRRRPESVAPESVRVRERAAEGAARDAIMTSIGPARFKHEMPPSSAATTFELVGGDDWLGPIRVDRVDRPALKEIKLRVRDPNASEGAFRAIEDTRQHLVFLPDTEVELTLIGTEPLSGAGVDVHPGKPPELSRVDPRSFSARWTLREATTLEIRLTSEATGLDSKPAFLSLGLLKDREPRVALRAQGVGVHVTPVATIPLTLAVTDDLGLASVRIQAERTVAAEDKVEPVTTRQTIPLPLATDGARAVLDHQARHDVDLQAAPPAIGTILRFIAEAEDRCARGPQVGRSAVVVMQVVSSDELFYEILIRQRAERAKFIAALAGVEKQGPALAGRPTAEAYTTAVRAMHAATRQLDQVAAHIGDSLQEMKLNQVGSPKSHRLLQDGVVDPTRALNTGPMNDLRGLLQALASGTPKEGQDAESARVLHGEVVARMKAILDQMSQWESFVDVVNQVAEVIKMQRKILQATEKARESRTQEVFDAKP